MHFDSFMVGHGYSRNSYDNCVLQTIFRQFICLFVAKSILAINKLNLSWLMSLK
jgi:hypothetical protein